MKSQISSFAQETLLCDNDKPFVDRRKERRYPTEDPVEVKLLPSANILAAKVVDVSKSGIRLALSQPLVSGANIEIIFPATQLVIFGEVRYCRKSNATFYAGVRIHDVSYSKNNLIQHLKQEELLRYVQTNHLNAGDLLRIERHVLNCLHCAVRLSELTRALLQKRLPPRGEVEL